MTSLSTRAFGPLALSLGLLLVTATAFPTPIPLGEDSKEDASSHRPPLFFQNQTEKRIMYILNEISALKEEMCSKSIRCENSKEALAENNLNLPQLTEKDGCFQSGFNQENCLMRITTGLLEFQIYLEYVQDKFEGDKGNTRAVQINTKALIQILKEKLKNPDAVTTPDPTINASLLATLQSQNEWLKHTTIHLILRSLTNFLQISMRAVRIM
ncbi:PREDICTED: interleukin-6 [Galeopterus variegatus]|uniref:Interleukin-6 n=1 Tax=Galeopterus variegatus TaxID=482537 RepID=A0ABM0QA65_GALVR|nr:PREDICTED: interleukin-6 [Galeopterus variegatus]